MGFLAEAQEKTSKAKKKESYKWLTEPGEQGFGLVIILFIICFFLDIVWVKSKGYSGLAPWWVFYIYAWRYSLYAGFGFLAITLLFFWVIRPKRKIYFWHYFSAWWLYITILGIFILNEEVIPGHFGLSNPLSIVLSLFTLLVSIIILRLIGIKIKGTRAEKFLQTKIIKGKMNRIILVLVYFFFFIVIPYGGSQVTKPKIGALPALGEGRKNPNVIIVTLDTLRADHVGIYGYTKPTTPNIDAFTSESIVFDNAFTPIPLTTPAHVSLFTGNLPQSHIVLENTSVFDSTPVTKPDGTEYANTAIGTILREHGYRSFAAVSAIHLGHQFGWGHFVDSLNEYEPPFDDDHWYLRPAFQITPLRLLAAILHQHSNPIRKSDSVVKTFDDWLWDWNPFCHHIIVPKGPFFAWLHFFDAHLPYDPPGEYLKKFDPDYTGKLTGSTHDVEMYNQDKDELAAHGVDLDRYVEHVKACYDGETLFMDEQFGKLIQILKDAKIYDNTLIIVCADHGEGLGERGFFGHNSVPFDYEMRIPFIVKPPNYQGGMKRIKEPVTLCDIAPTIYDITGIDAGVRMDGKSFADLLNGSSIEEEKHTWPVPGMVFLVAHSMRWPDRQVVRFLDREHQRVAWSYFDLVNDPGAFNDLYASEGILPEDDKLDLINWIDRTAADFQYLSERAQEKKDLDEWTIEQLKSVGYLQ